MPVWLQQFSCMKFIETDCNYEKKNTSGNETLTLEKKNTEESISKLDWKQQKEQLAQVRKLENEFKRVEETISKLEERSGVLDYEMALPENAVNVPVLQSFLSEKVGHDLGNAVFH